MTTFSFSMDAPASVKAGVLILPVFQGPAFGPGVKELRLEQAYRDAKLTGKKGESLLVTKRNGDRFAANAVLLLGVGERKEFDVPAMRKALGRVAASVGRFGHAATTFPQAVKGDVAEVAQAAAEGLGLGGYRFVRYKTKKDHTPLSRSRSSGTPRATRRRHVRRSVRPRSWSMRSPGPATSSTRRRATSPRRSSLGRPRRWRRPRGSRARSGRRPS